MLNKLIKRISMSTKNSQQFKLVGFTGILIVMFANIFSLFIFHFQQAVFFQTEWFVWLSNYIIWFSILIIGVLLRYKENNVDTLNYPLLQLN